MKTVRDFRNMDDFDPEDKQRGPKLPPVKKSGKERRIYDEYDDDEDLLPSAKRESVFDYFDDGEDD